MDEIKEMVLKTRKLTIKEFDELLKHKSEKNKSIFIEGFLRYIFSITKTVYDIYKDQFNAFYSFEDFFQDSVCLAEKRYDSFNYHSGKDNCFSYFCNYYRRKIQRLLANTYMFKISYCTWLKIMDNRKQYYDNSLIEDKYEKYWLSRVQESESFEHSNLIVSSFEDELIDNLVKDNIREDLILILKELKENTLDIICKLNGFSIDKTIINRYTQLALANEKNVTQQSIAILSKKAYKKIKKKYANYLEDYIR